MRTALVTGASRGIGKAIALRLCELGYRVHALGRDTTALDQLGHECSSLSGEVVCMAGDLLDDQFLDGALETILSGKGGLDVLVNNAGASSHAPVQTADMAAWDAVLDLNLRCVMHLSRRVLPPMIERQSGAIINVSSLSGRFAAAGSGVYAATKHAMIGFAGSMFEDAREFGIKVSTILPGFVETDMTARHPMNAARMIAPEDIADAVVFVLSSSARCCPTEIVIRPQRAP